MFEEIVIATSKAQAAEAANQLNKVNTDNYVQACRNWAAEKTRNVEWPKPTVPFKFIGVHNPETNGFTLEPTTEPVSSVMPEDFMKKDFGTDIDAVGGPVGGPIKDADGNVRVGMFALMSNYPAYAGQIYTHTDGRVFVCQQPTPFQKYWLQF